MIVSITQGALVEQPFTLIHQVRFAQKSPVVSDADTDPTTLKEARDKALEQIRNLLVTLKALAAEKQALVAARDAAATSKDVALSQAAAAEERIRFLEQELEESQARHTAAQKQSEAKVTELSAR